MHWAQCQRSTTTSGFAISHRILAAIVDALVSLVASLLACIGHLLARPGLLHYCPHVMASNFPLLGGLAPGSACPCALHRNDPTVWPRLEYNSVILTFFHRSAVLGIMTSFLIS